MSSGVSPIFRLPFQIDKNLFLNLLHEKGILNYMNEAGTLSLVHRLGAENPWFDGVTKMALNSGEDIPFSEADFKYFNPGLEGTYFEDCHKIFNELLSDRVGRVRLFRRTPQTSSSLHRDLDIRLHVALVSNKNSFLVFPDIGVFHVPDDGFIYLVNTTIPHFAVNTDPLHERLHVVCSSYCGFLEDRKNEDRIIQSNQDLFKNIIDKYSASEIEPLKSAK